MNVCHTALSVMQESTTQLWCAVVLLWVATCQQGRAGQGNGS
jgi:hypothetical protein